MWQLRPSDSRSACEARQSETVLPGDFYTVQNNGGLVENSKHTATSTLREISTQVEKLVTGVMVLAC